MTVIVSVVDGAKRRIFGKLFLQNVTHSPLSVLCKGAAERLKSIINDVPSWYDELVNKLALEGRRILVTATGELVGFR